METILELTFSKMKREWNLWRNLEKIDNKQGDFLSGPTRFLYFFTRKTWTGLEICYFEK